MVWFGDGHRVRFRAALVAGVVVWTLAATPAAMAEQRAAVRYTVTLVGLERFEGEVEPATFVCRSTGACAGQARMEVVGWPREYVLYASAFDTRMLLFFWRKNSRPPRLNHEWGNPVEVALAPDGAGRRDAALEALLPAPLHPDLGPGRHPEDSLHNGWPRWQRVPVANVRVTVRREGGAERNR